jgi:hypothetical protein
MKNYAKYTIEQLWLNTEPEDGKHVAKHAVLDNELRLPDLVLCWQNRFVTMVH